MALEFETDDTKYDGPKVLAPLAKLVGLVYVDTLSNGPSTEPFDPLLLPDQRSPGSPRTRRGYALDVAAEVLSDQLKLVSRRGDPENRASLNVAHDDLGTSIGGGRLEVLISHKDSWFHGFLGREAPQQAALTPSTYKYSHYARRVEGGMGRP